MSKTIYNKLVRSKIPNIIRDNGKIPNVEYKKWDALSIPDLVRVKLREEFSELMSAKSRDEIIEEAADLVEILETYLFTKGFTMEDLAIVKKSKVITKGYFNYGNKFTYLVDVEG